VDAIGGRKQLRNEELHNLDSISNRCANRDGYEARNASTTHEEMRNGYKILTENPEGENYLGCSGLDGMILLKLI
jgi:hypothetical protein